MWNATIPFTRVAERGVWKVEFFCAPVAGASPSHCDMVAVRQLVGERRESLEPQDDPDRLFNYVGLENVEPVTGELIGFAPKRGQEILSRSKVYREGDVLYGRLRPYLNKVFLADRVATSGICSGEFYVLQPNADLIRPHYLRLLLSSHFVQDVVGRLQSGATHPRLRLPDLLDIELPVPPLEEQDALEEFIVEVEATRRRLSNQLDTLLPNAITAVLDAVRTGVAPTSAT